MTNAIFMDMDKGLGNWTRGQDLTSVMIRIKEAIRKVGYKTEALSFHQACNVMTFTRK